MKKILSTDPILQYIVNELVLRLDPERVILFGSRARRDATDRSDYDVAVACPQVEKGQWSLTSQYIKEHNPSLLPIDLINLKEASQDLAAKIQAEGKILYIKGDKK